MKIAVVGCSHGGLNQIYSEVRSYNRIAEAKDEEPIRLLLCCGDFEALRNPSDLSSMDCPAKYRVLGDFHHYYSGRKEAEVITLVVGGNHESQSYLKECYHGGWLAPSIYFLGYAGCILVDGWLKVAGSSGIHDPRDWKKGHYEETPIRGRDIRTAFHTRQYDLFRLLQLKGIEPRPDIYMSHDWPRHIECYGDTAKLLKQKPGFAPQVARDNFGSSPLEAVLLSLKPRRWVSGHHHIRFTASVAHSDKMGDRTDFLALSKPNLPGTQFFEVIEVPSPASAPISPDSQPKLFFDPNWLAIVRAANRYFPTNRYEAALPPKDELKACIAEAESWIAENVRDGGKVEISLVQEFKGTAPPTLNDQGNVQKNQRREEVIEELAWVNPQTTAYCNMLGIEDVVSVKISV